MSYTSSNEQTREKVEIKNTENMTMVSAIWYRGSWIHLYTVGDRYVAKVKRPIEDRSPGSVYVFESERYRLLPLVLMQAEHYIRMHTEAQEGAQG